MRDKYDDDDDEGDGEEGRIAVVVSVVIGWECEGVGEIVGGEAETEVVEGI